MGAQVMATALAVCVTNETLAGTTAQSFGFTITETGPGTRTFNVGGNSDSYSNKEVRSEWPQAATAPD